MTTPHRAAFFPFDFPEDFFFGRSSSSESPESFPLRPPSTRFLSATEASQALSEIRNRHTHISQLSSLAHPNRRLLKPSKHLQVLGESQKTNLRHYHPLQMSRCRHNHYRQSSHIRFQRHWPLHRRIHPDLQTRILSRTLKIRSDDAIR
jgi:hypothetical protein